MKHLMMLMEMRGSLIWEKMNPLKNLKPARQMLKGKLLKLKSMNLHRPLMSKPKKILKMTELHIIKVPMM